MKTSGTFAPDTRRFRVSEHRQVIAITVAFSVIVAVLVNQMKIVSTEDMMEYINGAKNLARWDSNFHGPLYPLLIAGMAFVVRDHFLAAKLVSWLAGMLYVLSTYAIGRHCFPRRSVAITGAALVAVNPFVLLASYLPLSDMLSAALLVTSFAILLASRSDTRFRLFLAGVICGLAYLTRYVHLAGVPAALLYATLVLPGAWRQRVKGAALYLAGFVLTITPWSALLLVRHGNLHNDNHVNLIFAMTNAGDNWQDLATYAARYPTLLSVIKARPGQLAKFVWTRLVDLPSGVLLHFCAAAGLLCIPGFIALARRPSVARMGFLLASAFAVAPTLLIWNDSRYYLSVFPFVMLAAAFFTIYGTGKSLAHYWPSMSQPTWLNRIPVRPLLIALCVGLPVASSLRILPASIRKAKVSDLKQAGEYLTRSTPEGTVIIGHNLLGYFVQRPVLALAHVCGMVAQDPATAASRVARQANTISFLDPVVSTLGPLDGRVNVLVYNRRHGLSVCPSLEFLLDPSDPRVPDSYRVIYRTEGENAVVAYWIGAGSLH